MKSLQFLKKGVIVLLGLLGLMGCSSPPVEVPYADVCQIENNDKNVITEGVFALGDSMYCSETTGEYRCGLDFKPSLDAAERFSVDVVEGDGRNEMKVMPDSYTDADLQITTEAGNVIGVGDQARITGEMLVTADVCVMLVDKVE